MNFDDQKWDIVIGAERSAFPIDFRQILEYKDLIFLFVKRDIATTYKQTILGPLWYLVQPICTTIMCMIVFQQVANLGTDGIPPILFYSAGTVLWTFFSALLTAESRVFSAYKDIFGKVYFPRLTVPIAIFFGELLKFLIQFLLFAAVFIGYSVKGYPQFLSMRLFLLPLIIFWTGMQACGIGLVVSSVTTKYRDLAKALSFLLSLFMYVTPVVYPISEVPERYRLFFEANPLAAVMECFRMLCFGTGSVSVELVIYSVIWTCVVLLAGIVLFHKNEKAFVDVI